MIASGFRIPALADRRVVIPGGTGGVGEGVVRAWLRAGADVIVPTRSARHGDELRELVADEAAGTLHTIEARYGTFREADALAERIHDEFGAVTDVVASIGGWTSGQGLWDISGAEWTRYFTELTTSHVAVLRAFVPRLPERGSYSLVLGGSAYTPVPGSAVISMEQAALRMMGTVVGEEVRGRIGIHSLMMGPVDTRHRGYVDPDMISATEVGFVTVGYAATAAASNELVLRSHDEVRAELGRIGLTPEPVAATATASASKTPQGWPELPASLRPRAIVAEDTEYRLLRSSYMRVGSPHLVLRVENEDEVSQALAYAALVRRETGERVPFSVRSGGHGISGTSTNDAGIILDLSLINDIEILDPASGLFRAQTGAHWGDVANRLAPLDLALTTGNFGDTGVGGLATSGGVGYFARSQGLTLDHITRVRLATADGAIRWVDAEHEPDLFWAIRGGATQVGIALDLEFTAPRLNSAAGNASIAYQEVQYLVEDLGAFTAAWGEWMREAPREAESFLMLHNAGQGHSLIQARTVWAGDDAAAAAPTFDAGLKLGKVLKQSATVVPYTSIVPTPRQPHVGQQRIQMRDVLVDHANAELGAAFAETLGNPATAVAELRALGGAVADVPAAATAWAGRHQEVIAGIWTNPVGEAGVDRAFEPLQRLGTGLYGAYSSDIRPAAAELAWPGETGVRLREIAARVDPDALFDNGLVLPR